MAHRLLACRMRAQVKGVCHQELWEEVSSLHSIRDDDKGINWIFSEILQLQEMESTAFL